jgi:hypothetical protein
VDLIIAKQNKNKTNYLPSYLDDVCVEKLIILRFEYCLHIFCVSKFCQLVTKVKKGAKIVQRIFSGKNLPKVIIFLGGKRAKISIYRP